MKGDREGGKEGRVIREGASTSEQITQGMHLTAVYPALFSSAMLGCLHYCLVPIIITDTFIFDLYTSLVSR